MHPFRMHHMPHTHLEGIGYISPQNKYAKNFLEPLQWLVDQVKSNIVSLSVFFLDEIKKEKEIVPGIIHNSKVFDLYFTIKGCSLNGKKCPYYGFGQGWLTVFTWERAYYILNKRVKSLQHLGPHIDIIWTTKQK